MSQNKLDFLRDSLVIAFPDADKQEIDQYIDFLGQTFPEEDFDLTPVLEGVSLSGELGDDMSESLEGPDFTFDHIDEIDTVLEDDDVETDEFVTIDDYPLYLISATHDRHDLQNETSPFHSAFLGQPLGVKVPLPQRDGDTKVIKTRLGSVRQCDHFLWSIDAVNRAYSGVEAPFGFDYVTPYVELVTCARNAMTRFCPLSLYFIYRNVDDEQPTHYLMESGNGVGQTKVLYKHCVEFGESFYEKGQYQPTPFSDPENTYLGTASVEGRDPKSSSVTSYHYHMNGDEYVRDENPYITVSVSYKKISVIPSGKFPGTLIYQAASRIYTLLDGFGKPLFPFKCLAKNGRKLPWITQPPNNRTTAPQ